MAVLLSMCWSGIDIAWNSILHQKGITIIMKDALIQAPNYLSFLY